MEKYIKGSEKVIDYLYIFYLSLPLLFIMWLLRTYDKLKSSHENNYFNALNLLSKKDEPQSLRLTFVILLDLREKGIYKNEIEKKIFSGLEIKNTNLEGFDLSNINFQGTNFYGSNLNNTSVKYSVFHGASFWNASMRQVEVSEGNLFGSSGVSEDINEISKSRHSNRGETIEKAHLTRSNPSECDIF